MPTTQKIRYADCDPQAVVFNANYARYWDDAITDWFEQAGFGGEELGGIGVDLATVRIEIDLKAAARLGDVLTTTPEIERFGNTSMTVAVKTERESDGMLVAEGREVFVFIDPETRSPVPIPETVRNGLA